MKKIVGKICKYICATLCVVALAFFAGLTNLNKKSESGSTESALVSVNETTNKYIVVGGKVYSCPEESSTDSAEDDANNVSVVATMETPAETLQSISIYNSDLEFVFMKDGITDYNQAVQSLKTVITATQLTDEIASIVTATKTANSVEISIEDKKQTASISTSLDAVYSLNALALSVDLSLEYDNGNFMVATQQASVSLLADTTSVFSKKSALVMRLSEGNVTIKGRDADNVVTYAPSASTLGMGRAFYQIGGNLTIGENVVLKDFSATSTDLDGGAYGGAICVSSSSSTLTLNCTITNCTATYSGGAIYSNGTIIINGGSYSSNESLNSHGGFLYNYLNGSSGGVVTLNDGVISNNLCADAGGGIYSTNIANLNGGAIEYNKAEDTDNGGGGVYGSTVNINGTTIKGNSTNGRGNGGGVYGSTVNFTSGTISDNEASDVGGGICATTCTVAKGATIDGNWAGIYGGGICATTLKFTGSATISNNSADFGGAGIYIPSGGSYTSSGEKIFNNETSDGSGGGILYNSSSALTLIADIFNNYSEVNGGGICAESASSITLVGGSQIYNNTAYYGGGVYCSCIISYDNGSSSIGIFNNSIMGSKGCDIYFNSASVYLDLIAGKSYSDGTIVSIYKYGLTSCNIDTAVPTSSTVVKGVSGTTSAYNFKKYLVVENFDISTEATYGCRVNYILSSKSTSTYVLYAEPDDCLLGIVPGYGNLTGETTNEASDRYTEGTLYARNVRKAWSYYDIDDPSTKNSPMTDIGSTYCFTNNFTVNLWADMDSYANGWETFTTDMVLASNGGTQGWRLGANSSGYIQARFYDSSSSSYKYATLSIKYTSLTGWQMFTITVSSGNLASLVWQGKSSDTTEYRRATVQLSGPLSYQKVVGPGTSIMVIGGQSYISGSSLIVLSSSYFKGAIRAFQISDQVFSVNNIKTIYAQGQGQGAAIWVKGKSGDTYSLATSMYGSSASNSFKGWRFYLPDGQTEPPGSLNEYTFTFGETKYDIISYVKGVWGTGDYTVVFDSNNGSGKVVRQTISYDTSTALTKNTFTRTGYTFLGWSKSANALSGTYSDGASVKNLTTSSQVILYATWSPNTICLTLSHEEADNAKKIDNEVYYRYNWKAISGYYTSSLMEDDYDVTDGLTTLPTKAGYTFMGYYSEQNGSGTRWINDQGKFLYGLYNNISSDKTLYALFSPKVITINLINQGGSSEWTTLYCLFGVNKYYTNSYCTYQCTKITASRTGYDFMGYYLGTTQYVDANGYFKDNLCTATTEDSINLYASWQTTTYTITVKIQQPSSNSGASFNNVCLLYVHEIGGSSYRGGQGTLYVEHGSTISTSGNELKVGNYEVLAEIQSTQIPDGYTVTFDYWTNTSGIVTANRTITACYKATPIKYTLQFIYLNNNNTKLFDGEDSNIRLTLIENKESDSSLRWYYLIEYTIEDEVFLPYAKKEYYNVNGWNISSATDGDWGTGLYECGDYYDGCWGNAIFSLSTTANAFTLNFVCDPDGKGREDEIYANYPELEKTIYVTYNGTLKSNAYYTKGTTKVYLNWESMPWIGGIDGWYKNADYTGSEIKVTTQCNYGYFVGQESTNEFTLYCKWKPITIVFFGETPQGQGKNSDIQTSALATVTLADPVTSATSGYTFKGWYTSQYSFTDSNYVGGAGDDFEVTFIYTPIYLYAYWEVNKYTITWDASEQTSGLLQAKYWNYANGDYTSSNDGYTNQTTNYSTGTYTITSTVAYGSSELGYCAPTPIRAGYTFVCWADDYGNRILKTDFKTFDSSTEDSISSPINENGVWDYTGNITLHAVWTVRTYTITVNTDGGTYSGTAPTSYSATKSATISEPSKTGYTFQGWQVTASLSRSTQATINLNNGYLEYNSGYSNAVFYEPFYMVDGIAYTATKRSLSGSGKEIRWREFNTDGTYYGSRSTSETLTGQGKYAMLWYHNGNTNTSENVSFKTSATEFETSKFKSTGNLTLTALWETNTYTIEYDLAKGTKDSNAPESATYGTVVNISNPSRTGYMFAGWKITGMDSTTHYYGTSSNSLLATKASSLSGLTATYFKNLRATSGTVTFTAVWLVKNIEITVDANGGSLMYYVNGTGYNATNSTLYGVPCTTSLYVRAPYATTTDEPKYYDGTSKFYSDIYTQAYATTVGLVASRIGYTYGGLYSGSTLVVSSTGNVQKDVTISGTKITDSSGCWVAWSSSSSSSSSASIGLKADWTRNTYTVKFDENSLSSAPTVSGYTRKIQDYKYEITFDYTFTVNNPSRTGYEFAGWYITNGNGSKVVYDGTTRTSFKSLTNKNGDVVTFIALWKTKYIKLNIDSNSGVITFSHNSACLYAFYGDGFIYYLPTGYQNNPYYSEDKDGNGEFNYVDSNGLTHTISSSSIQPVSLSSASRTGYSFSGLSATKTIYDANLNTNMNNFNTAVLSAQESGTLSLSLSADWTANTYIVNFDSYSLYSDLTVSGDAQKIKDFKYKYKITFGKTFTVSNPTRTGYKFNGWEIISEHDVSTAVMNNGDTQTTFQNLTPTDNGTVTLKAIWLANTYKVTFDANGGVFYNEDGESYEQDVQDVEYGKNYGGEYGKLPTPERRGYTFKGWYTEDIGGDKRTAYTTVKTANDHTLYAHWSETEYTITVQLFMDYRHASNLTFTHYDASKKTTITIENGTATTITFSISDTLTINATKVTRGASNNKWYGFVCSVNRYSYLYDKRNASTTNEVDLTQVMDNDVLVARLSDTETNTLNVKTYYSGGSSSQGDYNTANGYSQLKSYSVSFSNGAYFNESITIYQESDKEASMNTINFSDNKVTYYDYINSKDATITAPLTYEVSGVTYKFDHWWQGTSSNTISGDYQIKSDDTSFGATYVAYKKVINYSIYIDPTYTHLHDIYIRNGGTIATNGTIEISKTSSISITAVNVKNWYQGDYYGFEIVYPDGTTSQHKSVNGSDRSDVTTTISGADLWEGDSPLTIKSCKFSTNSTTYGNTLAKYNKISYGLYYKNNGNDWIDNGQTSIYLKAGTSADSAVILTFLMRNGESNGSVALGENINLYIFAKKIFISNNSLARGFVVRFNDSYMPIDFTADITVIDGSYYWNMNSGMIVKPSSGYSSGMNIYLYPGQGTSGSSFGEWNYWNGTEVKSIGGNQWSSTASTIGDVSNAVLMVVNNNEDKQRFDSSSENDSEE